MTSNIRPLLPMIAEGTAAIESAFLSAGEGLGQGLAAFKSLSETLNALGTELASGSTASASVKLGRMSRTLRRIGERLPVDGQVLTELLGGNHAMRRKFDDLLGDMRMMVIVSRSARLEAAASGYQRFSLDEFSLTIDEQIGDVQRRIDACAGEHAKLTALLEQAARAHLAFEAGFGGRLVELAADLEEALGVIGHRRDAGLAFMEEAAGRTRHIGQATGLALVSLQIGDNTRQRLEHITSGLEHADAIFDAGDGDADAATVDLLCRLQDAQLRDTAATFDDEASSILNAFSVLGREAAMLVSSGQATYGRDPAGTASFMTGFKARFETAMDLVKACEATRRAVEQAIGALRAMLDALDETLTRLGQTGQDLLILAVNVGLKAARLGSDGRGLVTVAAELKRLAGQISLQTDTLLTLFRPVRQGSDHFGQARDDEDGPAGLEAEAASTLDEITRADTGIAELLAQVERTGSTFDATLAKASRAFEGVMGDMVRLCAVADRLGAETALPSPDATALVRAAERVNELLLPLYTMAQERDVHAAVVPGEDAAQDVEDRAA